MNRTQFRLNKYRMVSLVSAVLLLAPAAMPVLASNNPDRSVSRPVHCCVVIPGDQTPYSGDCFSPGEFLAMGQAIPHTGVYEDFIADYAGSVRGTVDFLGVAGDSPYSVAPPFYEKLADEISEEWVQRYQEARQRG